MATRLKVTVQHGYNLNSSRADFPTPLYLGRTPLWPVDRLNAWRAAQHRTADDGGTFHYTFFKAVAVRS